MKKFDLHLDVYLDRSELYDNGKRVIFKEGRQSKAAQARYSKVINTLGKGYLETLYDKCVAVDTSNVSADFKQLLKTLVDGVTSEVGRALVGLAFLQLTIKSIVPEQSIRLHKGSDKSNGFSWEEGISMRTIDSSYNTPFLREKGLLNVNKYGIMMTRSLAENYPYSKLYKAEMRGAFDTWIKIVDILETEKVDYYASLSYMLLCLIHKSNKFEQIVQDAMSKLDTFNNYTFGTIENLLIEFFTNTKYSARAFEVVIHGFMQAYKQHGYTDLELVEMSQMRSANKKHGNVGDIEIKDGRRIDEAWDAKYGKSYLYDELSELQDKLEINTGVSVAGFIVNDVVDLKPEVIERIDEVATITGTEIKLLTFKQWIAYKMEGVPSYEWDDFSKTWLRAVVESFARKRLDIAPIDEPCDGWLKDLVALLSK